MWFISSAEVENVTDAGIANVEVVDSSEAEILSAGNMAVETVSGTEESVGQEVTVDGQYLSVKVPCGKGYHQLAKLDERFKEEQFKYYMDMGFSIPKFVSSNPKHLYQKGLSEF